MHKIKIRSLEVSDAENIYSLRNDDNSESAVAGPKRIVSLDREREWIREVTLRDRMDIIYMAIIDEESEEFMGYMSITNIDYRNGSCAWGGTKILPKYSGRGIATASARMLLKYAFEELRMERVEALCLENNIASLRLIAKVGMKREGVIRRSVFKNGIYNNVILHSIMREEYLTLY